MSNIKLFVCIKKISLLMKTYSATCIVQLISRSLFQVTPKPASQNTVIFFCGITCFNTFILWGRNGQRLGSRSKFSSINVSEPLNTSREQSENVLQYFWKNRQKFKILDDALPYGNKIFLIPPESSCECLQQWREVRTSSVLR